MVDHLEQVVFTEEELYRKAIQEENEMAKQARTYTLLDRDRQQQLRCGGVGGAKLLHTKRIFEIFAKEQDNIKTDLVVATRKEKVVEDNKKQKRLSTLLKLYDHFDEVTKQDTQEIKELEYQIEEIKKKFVDLAAKQISDQKILERKLKAEQTLAKLENKLEVEIRKCCYIGSENRKLREDLKHLLMERTNFNQAWDELIRKLLMGKRIMMDLIEQATIAYNQRDEWCAKLDFLRLKAHADYKAHLTKMRDYQRTMDHTNKTAQFFSVKNQKRTMVDLQYIFDEKVRRQREKTENRLDYCESLMTTICQTTQKTSVESIAKAFLRQEEENFSQLKYVNDINKDLEEINDRLFENHKQIENQQQTDEDRTSTQASKLEELKAKLEAITKEANDKKSELNQADAHLKKIMNDTRILFNTFNCKQDPIVKILGNHGDIDHYNVLLYLQIIEANVQEALVTTFSKEKPLRQSKNPAETHVVNSEKIPIPIAPLASFCMMTPCPLCIEHEMVSDIVDERQFAYNKEEIQEKLNQRIALEHIVYIVHNVSACNLPKSREIMQQRYQ